MSRKRTQRGLRKGSTDKDDRGHCATIFVSYSHRARKHMLVFRKHLEGLLFEKTTVWSDEAISHGDKWESTLRKHLDQADAALILVTPDFLASKWCREELKQIASRKQDNRIKKVFWVQVEPSGWQGTVLEKFQAWGFNLKQALTGINDLHRRECAIINMCEEIAREMDVVRRSLDSDFAFVRQLIMDYSDDRELIVDSPISREQGLLATVCRGRRGAEDVAIKVFKRSPIEKLVREFVEYADARKNLNNQCFLKVLDHFTIKSGYEQYTVVVEEYVPTHVTRLDKYLQTAKTLSIDEVTLLLRRAAEAFKEFHDTSGIRSEGKTYGLLTSNRVYYDKRNHKLLIPAIGVSNFLWHAIGWDRLASWQEEERSVATYIAPEQDPDPSPDQCHAPVQPEDAHKTDQYMLGQLAFEMLEGKLPFDIRRPSEVKKKKDFWASPEETAKGRWPVAHPAFAKVVFKMLSKNPNDRWRDFDEVIKRLRTMEEEKRALAKRTYETGIKGFRLKGNEGFFNNFYKRFFKISETAEEKFKHSEHKSQQPKKLMEAMVAVLNFHASNEPTALSATLRSHLRYKITPKEVNDFHRSFLETLKEALPNSIPTNERDRIIHAWDDLFVPVVEYFKEGLERPNPTKNGRDS